MDRKLTNSLPPSLSHRAGLVALTMAVAWCAIVVWGAAGANALSVTVGGQDGLVKVESGGSSSSSPSTDSSSSSSSSTPSQSSSSSAPAASNPAPSTSNSSSGNSAPKSSGTSKSSSSKSSSGSSSNKSASSGSSSGGSSGSRSSSAQGSGVSGGSNKAKSGKKASSDQSADESGHDASVTVVTEQQKILSIPAWVFGLLALVTMAGLVAAFLWMRAHKKVRSRVALGLSRPVNGFATSDEFNARLNEEVTRARSFGDPLGLMLIGTDDGSVPSRRVVGHVEKALRETDVIGYASDEYYAVIAPRREIIDLIELRSTIEKSLSEDSRCSAEIGIAELEPYEDSPEDLWDRAVGAVNARHKALELAVA